jgi:hypothetical protein
MKKLLSYGVSVIITIAALWYLLKGITSEEWTLIGQDFGNLNWLYVALGVVVSLLSHVVRAERYRTIMRPLYPDLRFISSFNAVMIGYAFNTILPRAGEVVRPLVFARRESIRTEEVFSLNEYSMLSRSSLLFCLSWFSQGIRLRVFSITTLPIQVHNQSRRKRSCRT